MTAPRIYMVAAEPSGDLLAREVVEVLRDRVAGISIAGIGGDELAKVGVVSAIDIAPLSVLGYFEALKSYKTVVELADAAADSIVAFNPDAVVLVDSWGFMLRVAQRVRKRAPHIKLIKLVGPQVWATRPGRAKTLAASVDHLICIHAMEVAYYASYALEVTVMGNPALSRTRPTKREDAVAYKASIGIAAEDEVVLILPGSRVSEIKRVAPIFVEAAQAIKAARPSTHIIFAPELSVRTLFLDHFGNISDWAVVAPESTDRYALMAAADFALACSGTVTSELAVQGTPFLVGYKTDWITWAIARYFLYKPKHVTLLNIAAGDAKIVPEFIQTKFTPSIVSQAALARLDDEQALKLQCDAQNKALSLMIEAEGRAPEKAANSILSVVSAA